MLLRKVSRLVPRAITKDVSARLNTSRSLSSFIASRPTAASSVIVTPNQYRQFSSTKSLGFQVTSATLEKRNIVVPQLAESLSEGDIRFEKAVGDVVNEDDVLAGIETDKTSIPINSPVAGKIVELLVEDGSTVKPGQAVIVIDTDAAGATAAPKSKPANESQSASSPQPPSPPPQQAPQQQQQQQQQQPQQPPTPPSFPSLSQQQTAFAQQKSSVSVESVRSEIDELSRGQFVSNMPQQQRTVSAVKMNRMRQKIASRLKDAQNTYAMLTTFNEIDMSNLMEMRNRYKDAFLKKHNVKLGFMSAFVKATAYALKDQPVVNAVIEENQILYRDFIDISVAVATPKGLVVPVLRNVDHMNFADIEKNINLLGEKAKNNALTVADMEGGTFTISNGGVFGSLFGTPIINPPQSAILGMHAIKEKPVAVNGQVVIRPVMVVALTYDHRLIDGREAVTFLKKVVDVIQDPRMILLDL